MQEANFSYRYCAERRREVESIREKYIPREESKLERLHKLDERVENAGMIEALCIGIVGCLVFGVGMCIGLGAISAEIWLGVVLGVLGAVIMLPAYPVYKYLSGRTRARLAPEILSLTEQMITEAESTGSLGGAHTDNE